MEAGQEEEATIEQIIGQVSLVCECGRRSEIRIALVPGGNQTVSSPPLLPVPERSPVTAFEMEVLQYVAAGHTDRETARELGVSLSSVRNAVRTAIAHLSTRNRPEAIFKAVAAGYLTMVAGPRAGGGSPGGLPPLLPHTGSHKVPHKIA